jgi:hypothetical protein
MTPNAFVQLPSLLTQDEATAALGLQKRRLETLRYLKDALATSEPASTFSTAR